MVEKRDFPKIDLNHEFIPFDESDKKMLRKAKNILLDMGGGKRDAVYWYCLRYWTDQRYKEEIYEKIFGKKVR